MVITKTGFFASAEAYTSGFKPCTESLMDFHAAAQQGPDKATAAADLITALNQAGGGEEEKDQYFEFECKRCNASSPKIKESGFKIDKTAEKDGNGVWSILVQKQGYANNGVEAGAISDTGTKTVDIP